jgi:TolA-binding protein
MVKEEMRSAKFHAALFAVLLIGVLPFSSALAAKKDDKTKQPQGDELGELREENARLKQQVDDLNSKFELLVSRLDQMEKTIAELKNQVASTPRPAPIKEEPVAVTASAKPEFSVRQPEPKPGKPDQSKTMKVITFGDDKNNPNNPKIVIKEEPARGSKPADKNKVTELKVPKESAPEAETLPDQEIKQLLADKKFSQAEAAVKARFKEQPPEAETCVLYVFMAQARTGTGNKTGAADAYLALANRHPTCEQAPEAMFKAGELWQKSDPKKSEKIFQELVSLYPYSNYANLAQAKLNK